MGKSTHTKLSLKDRKLLDEAIRCVENHISDDAFGVEELKDALGISRSQLHRRLHDLTGLSTSYFIRSIRLKYSYSLLKEGNLSVSEIAYQSGFSSPSYFNKCFLEQYGFPPGEIHKQKITEIDPKQIILPATSNSKKIVGHILNSRQKFSFYAGGIVLILASVFFYVAYKSQINDVNLQKSIAVLPFKNFSGNPENQYVSDGMMEAILLNISKIGELKVISRTSVEQYRKSTKTVGQIAEELGVNHILEGSTFQDQDNFRITIQLINARTDDHIWSESYDQNLHDMFNVQKQVAIRIADELKAKLTPSEQQYIAYTPTESSEAYDYYQQAQLHFVNYVEQRKPSDFAKGKELFKKAIAEDSTYADPYTQLADLYWIKNYRSEYHSDTFMDTVRFLCTKALKLNPNGSNAHRILGQYYLETGDRADGLRSLETAISINKNDAMAYQTLGFYNNWLGNWHIGIPYLEKSIILDPYSIFVPERNAFLGRAYLDLCDFERVFFYTKQVIDQVGESKPISSFAFWMNAHSHLILAEKQKALDNANKLGAVVEIAGLRLKAEIYSNLSKDYKRAVSIFKDLQIKDPNYFNYKHRFAYALWETGKVDSAQTLFNAQIVEFEKEIELGRIERNDPYYNLAGIYAFLGKHEKAYEMLHKHKFTSGLEIYAKRDPLFKSLHDQKAFLEIMDVSLQKKKLIAEKIITNSIGNF